jgi:hypothetical protein
MNTEDQDRFLRNILEDETSSGFREQSLRHGLRLIRRRRLVRNGLKLGMLPVFLLLVVWMANFPERKVHTTVRRSNPAPTHVVGKVKFINDEQLLALFPDRSVALVGKPGSQQLLFLDEPKGSSGGKM